MTHEAKDYSVGQLAALSGVSVRTLHHYDDIGLLKPASVAENGYRIYGQAEAFRLQEILFYREAGFSLTEIGELLKKPRNAVDRLVRHRERLKTQSDRIAATIETLDATIAHLRGEKQMQIDELYKPFSEEKQAGYEAELIAEHGPEMADRITASKAAIRNLPDGIAGKMDQLRTIEADLVGAFETGVQTDSDTLHALLERHRDWVSDMWGRPCPPEGFAGLADMYGSQPDFVARYETLSPGFSKWLPTAMKAHAERLLQED